jgi:hypothetical protein
MYQRRQDMLMPHMQGKEESDCFPSSERDDLGEGDMRVGRQCRSRILYWGFHR